MAYEILATYDRRQNLGGEVSKVEKADKLGGVRCNAHWGKLESTEKTWVVCHGYVAS